MPAAARNICQQETKQALRGGLQPQILDDRAWSAIVRERRLKKNNSQRQLLATLGGGRERRPLKNCPP